MPEYQSVINQKHIWSNCIKQFEGQDGHKLYGYEWGDPEASEALNKPGMVLGNYKHIKDDYLMPSVAGGHVIDIGSLGGKWMPFMKGARVITCVDITDAGFDFITKNLSENELPSGGIVFYLTKGDELHGIPSNSVDFIFSMDSLVRSEIGIFERYFLEWKRVLAPGGKACIHLPCSEQKMSWELGFTNLLKKDIEQLCDLAEIRNFRIDTETINHGVLLLINI